jgi:NurA-like 5'-3' nuclease
MTINSVNDTIAEMDLKEKTDNFIKQGLSDIRDIQVEYKKKYHMLDKFGLIAKKILISNYNYSCRTAYSY